MKKIYFIIFSISLIINCFAQKVDQIQSEIIAIENGLIKNIQIKGDSILEFNILERMEFYKVPLLGVECRPERTPTAFQKQLRSIIQ